MRLNQEDDDCDPNAEAEIRDQVIFALRDSLPTHEGFIVYDTMPRKRVLHEKFARRRRQQQQGFHDCPRSSRPFIFGGLGYNFIKYSFQKNINVINLVFIDKWSQRKED